MEEKDETSVSEEMIRIPEREAEKTRKQIELAGELQEQIKSGRNIREAAELMGISLGYAYKIKKVAIQNDKWSIGEETKQAQVPERYIRRNIARAISECREYRKVARIEDKLELNGKENVSVEGRKKFIKTLTTINISEINIPGKDIEMILNAFYMHPEIANKDIIKFLISHANKSGGLKAVGNILDILIEALQDTGFYGYLVAYKRWVKKLALFPQIRDMKEQGMNHSEIGTKLGLTSAEVSVIFHNDRVSQFPDFDEI